MLVTFGGQNMLKVLPSAKDLNTETAFDFSKGVQTTSSVYADQWELRILCGGFHKPFFCLYLIGQNSEKPDSTHQ